MNDVCLMNKDQELKSATQQLLNNDLMHGS